MEGVERKMASPLGGLGLLAALKPRLAGSSPSRAVIPDAGARRKVVVSNLMARRPSRLLTAFSTLKCDFAV